MLKPLFFLALAGAASASNNFANFELVAEKQECGGREFNSGRKHTLQECANSCRGTSSMFIYGTNDFGVTRCNYGGCNCFCELAASDDGTCDQTGHGGYRLYKYESVNIDWELIGEKKECSGSETNMGYMRTIAQCADACRATSSVFIFGTNDFGERRCFFPCRGCSCYCETESSSGKCNEEIDHNGYRLYSISDGNDTEDGKDGDEEDEGEMDDCLPLSEVRGRCGPTYGGRCNRDLAWWAVYCNEDNGWCGTTCRHKHAQSADRYDWEPSNCKVRVNDKCTGSFQENDASDAGNGLQRPPLGTKCVEACVIESGRWGSSWCYTAEDRSQWGAECVDCSDVIVKNTGKDCWRPCGKQQGECDWCGAGVCCRSGWWDRRNGCDGTIGGARRHECVEASEGPGYDPVVEAGLKNAGKNCWWKCGKKQGACDWCGTGVCCRSGWHDTSNGCDGSIGHHRRHACVLPVPSPPVWPTDAPEPTAAPTTQPPTTLAPVTEAPEPTAAPTTQAPEEPDSELPSGGLVCQSDDECKTEAEMGGNWGMFFANQPNAPCLDMSSFGNDGMFCFTSTTGSLKACSCWDSDEEFDNEWCNTGRFGNDHTMCIYNEGAQEACGEVRVAGITDQALKDSIVSKHNELRAKVANGQEDRGVDGAQPKAANMMELVWSDDLAEVAQRWVDQCAGAHDANRRTEKYSSVGQNWAARYGGNHDDSSALADFMVEAWYDEVADITLKAVNSFSSDQAVTGSTGVIGHYTQVVWADTAEVGCGYMTSFVNNRLESVLVCNYGPGGNWLGNAVYEQGEPGSNCPAGTSPTSAGLCA